MPRRRTVTRYISRARRATRARGFGGMGGVIGNLIAGAAAGVAAPLARGVSPAFGPGAAYAGIGWLMHNPTLQTLGGLSLAQGVMGTVQGGGSAAGAGWY